MANKKTKMANRSKSCLTDSVRDVDGNEAEGEIEEQFILRLPIDEARKVREMMRKGASKLKKFLKLDLNMETNRATVNVGNKKLYGAIKKLPTIIESYKTNLYGNKTKLFKTADVNQMIDCRYEESIDDGDKSMHGLCPPLKNIKFRRFRRTITRPRDAVEAEMISKEISYLLNADFEAVSTRFEILYENDNNKAAVSQNIDEVDLFGSQLSDTESESKSNSENDN